MIEPGSDARVLCLALAMIAVLLVALGSRRAAATPPPARGPSRAPTRARLAYALLAVAPSATLLPLAPWALGATAFGDGVTHARVIAEIAASGLPHGWIGSYLGGFPFAEHYPPLAWLLGAALVALGRSPLYATHLLGFAALALTPLAFFWATARIGLRPLACVAGAWFLAALSPESAFVGGYESFFRLGLLSQVIALPLLLVTASLLVEGRSHHGAALVGSLAVLAHPQLTLVFALVAAIGAAIARDRRALWRVARALLTIGAVALAVYGPGLLTMSVPFGWPSGLGYRHLGFRPERALAWLRDGGLLDARRPIVLTDLALLALFTIALLGRHRAAQVALGALGVALAIALGGYAIDGTPGLRWLLAVLQPLRAITLVPAILALIVTLAIDRGAPHVERALLGHGRTRTIAPHAATILATACLALMAPALLERRESARHGAADVIARTPCEGLGDPRALAASLARLEGGRLYYAEADARSTLCLNDGALQLASRVPLATSLAVGTHVGVEAELFGLVPLGTPRASAALEAIGARYVVSSAPLREGFTRIGATSSPLYESDARSGLVGVGCVRERMAGSERALRAAIEDAIDATRAAERFLDPRRLVAWRTLDGPLAIERVDDDCDADDARVEEREREPGALEASVTTSHPVDVVLRITAHPGWRASVDGVRAPLERIAPGFLSLRVSPGRHRVEARFEGAPHRLALVVLGALLVALVNVPFPARARSSERWYRLRRTPRIRERTEE